MFGLDEVRKEWEDASQEVEVHLLISVAGKTINKKKIIKVKHTIPMLLLKENVKADLKEAEGVIIRTEAIVVKIARIEILSYVSILC